MKHFTMKRVLAVVLVVLMLSTMVPMAAADTRTAPRSSGCQMHMIRKAGITIPACVVTNEMTGMAPAAPAEYPFLRSHQIWNGSPPIPDGVI